MALVMLAILDPGDEVIAFSPYFPMYREQIELAGGVCVDVPTYASEDYAIDEARLRAAITPRTKAIVFNNPTNPTGMGYDGKTLELLARVAQEHDLLIAADEIYTTCLLYTSNLSPVFTPEQEAVKRRELEQQLYEVFRKYADKRQKEEAGA